MKRYILLVLLCFIVLSLSACTRGVIQEEVIIAKPVLDNATMEIPLVVQDNISLPLAGSTSIDVRFFNNFEETIIGFGTDLRDKATILCFGLEGENANMVLRASPVLFAPSEEKELEILLEDKSRSTKGKKFVCTLQFYNGLGDVFQEDFDVVLV